MHPLETFARQRRENGQEKNYTRPPRKILSDCAELMNASKLADGTDDVKGLTQAILNNPPGIRGFMIQSMSQIHGREMVGLDPLNKDGSLTKIPEHLSEAAADASLQFYFGINGAIAAERRREQVAENAA